MNCIKVSSTDLKFKRVRGIFLETLQWERASSRDDEGRLFFSSCGTTCGVSLELRWGTQGASRVAPGMSSLHLSWEGELGIALESLQGK